MRERDFRLDKKNSLTEDFELMLFVVIVPPVTLHTSLFFDKEIKQWELLQKIRAVGLPTTAQFLLSV